MIDAGRKVTSCDITESCDIMDESKRMEPLYTKQQDVLKKFHEVSKLQDLG